MTKYDTVRLRHIFFVWIFLEFCIYRLKKLLSRAEVEALVIASLATALLEMMTQIESLVTHPRNYSNRKTVGDTVHTAFRIRRSLVIFSPASCNVTPLL